MLNITNKHYNFSIPDSSVEVMLSSLDNGHNGGEDGSESQSGSWKPNATAACHSAWQTSLWSVVHWLEVGWRR